MNENIDLTKILKDCPKGAKLYSTTLGEVKLEEVVNDSIFPILVSDKDNIMESFTSDGQILRYRGECTLFPSKDQRDWSKFRKQIVKNEKFDPGKLKPFDKVLVRDIDSDIWKCSFFSSIVQRPTYKYRCIDDCWARCIPYNDGTKHLVGTKEEAPEYYKYWSDSE